MPRQEFVKDSANGSKVAKCLFAAGQQCNPPQLTTGNSLLAGVALWGDPKG
jgi:hypothetical protein